MGCVFLLRFFLGCFLKSSLVAQQLEFSSLEVLIFKIFFNNKVSIYILCLRKDIPV